MKKVLSMLVGVVLLSIFAGTLYYLWSKSEEPPIVYETESPSVKTIIQKTVATGSVVPRREVEIKPQVSGIVDQLFVEAGETVGNGDLIARIRIIPDMLSLNNAQNRLSMARINLANSDRELNRNKQSLDDGTIPEADFRGYELAFESAQQELQAAGDNLDLIRKGSTKTSGKTSNTLVRATIDGTVLEVPLEEGDSVIEANTFNEGTTVATIADMEELIFEGKVDESEVGKIAVGMSLLLTIGAIADERFDATLEHIAPKGVEADGAIQFEIRAALELKEGILVRANYSANADIVLDRRDEVLTVNERLLQFDDGKPFVEVESDPQTFERREIETGLSDGISIEVISGLTESDRIKNPNAVATR
jgi:HlyD family secretion protein